MLATNSAVVAISNEVQSATGISLPVVDPNDPAEVALHQVMVEDDQATDEVDKWIQDNNAFAANGAGIPKEELNQRIRARFDLVRKAYQDYLLKYPNSARGHLAYGTFLNDLGEEDAGAAEYEKSKTLDPTNPAVWNNLANYYGEYGGVTNAFVDYTEAIRLDPTEPIYYQNFGTTVYLFRKDAKEFYHIDEQQTFDKALGLYRQAMQLSPTNLVLATDYAESYYGIKPLRTNDALVAWTNALNLTRDDNEREGVLIHLARVKITAGFYQDAQADLDAITNSAFADMKGRLERSLVEHKNRPKNASDENPTNAPASTLDSRTAPKSKS